jgi:hypothetical protein
MKERIVEFHETAENLICRKIYEKYSKYCDIACKFCNFLYVSVGILTIMNPLLVKLVTGNLVLPYGFKLPFIDENSWFGYAINFAHHLLQVFVVVPGLIFTDSIYAILIISIYCVYDVI